MHFARRPEPHASKDTPVTSDDLVPRILAAIEQAEQDARTDIDHFDDDPQPEDPRDRYIVKLAHASLRRCAADRRAVRLWQVFQNASNASTDMQIVADQFLANLATSYDITKEGGAGHRIDLSRVDLSGSIDKAALDRVTDHATHRDTELKIEVHFNPSDEQAT